MADPEPLHPGQLLAGPLFSELMRVETVRANGPETWVAGLVRLRSNLFRSVTLTRRDLATLTIQDTAAAYTGAAWLLRLGLQTYTPGIAHKVDPCFGLSVSRVDHLPHRLEAVCDAPIARKSFRKQNLQHGGFSARRGGKEQRRL